VHVHGCSSYVAKENERRSELGLAEGESHMELEDNEELLQLGMIAFTFSLLAALGEKILSHLKTYLYNNHFNNTF